MEPNKEGTTSELESFRQQWLSDLRIREANDESSGQARHEAPSSPTTARAHRHHEPSIPSLAGRHPVRVEDDEGYVGRVFDEPAATSGRTLADTETATVKKDLVSALDHYEEAMEKEGQGNMGESLTLYRTAYKLDHRVDRKYREKHFPGGVPTVLPPPRLPAPNSTAPAQMPAEDATEPRTMSIGELIASFSGLKVEPAPPEIEGTPPPPSPISELPDELLVHILRDVAVDDVGDFARLAIVCKHFAYLVATEQRIWRRVCVGSEVGFTAMHYHWQTAIEWDPLNELEVNEDGTFISPRELAARRRGESLLVTRSLCPSVYPTWKAMFRSRPRVRFNGCYICTVNYVRTGQASTNLSTWGSNPIHIVTYYRYLRLYRDGSAISLLTTAEPVDVVHHLTKDMLMLHRGNAHAHLPSAVMNQAYKGRWRLSSSALNGDSDEGTAAGELQEGDLYVETEGVGVKYMYRMDLTLRNAGKGGARNNKLGWKGHYSYNKLTDDWAEFGLKNDKPFFFSRVKSYKAGE